MLIIPMLLRQPQTFHRPLVKVPLQRFQVRLQSLSLFQEVPRKMPHVFIESVRPHVLHLLLHVRGSIDWVA